MRLAQVHRRPQGGEAQWLFHATETGPRRGTANPRPSFCIMNYKYSILALLAASAMLSPSSALSAQPKGGEPGPVRLDGARSIVTQPAQDLGVVATKIPAVVTDAAARPYSTRGLGSCRALAASVRDLDVALGPDFDAPPLPPDNRATRIVEAGGRAIVNSVVPFRSVVRELTGAATAKREAELALDAALARRGFLRGLQAARGCKVLR